MSWTRRSATEIAAAVRAREVTAVDVVAQHLARVQALDADLGAFRVVRGEQALVEARTVDGHPDLAALPLAGVPVGVKDNTAVAGEANRSGTEASSGVAAEADHEVVARLRAAGAVVVGLTSMPELGLFPLDGSVYGGTRNPWDPQRTPGGSSAGSAAAVGAGMVPVAQGNDALGSIRVPAAACGLVGLKPGPGVVPAPFDGEADPWFGLGVNGPLATTVADAAAVLSVMAQQPGWAAPAAADRPLRVRLSTRSPAAGLPLDRQYAGAVRSTGRALAAAGHEVRAADPPYPPTLGATIMGTWCACAERATAGLDRRRLGRPARRLALGGPLARMLGLAGRDAWRGWCTRLDAFFDDADVLVTPALAQPPPRRSDWSGGGLMASVAAASRYSPFASPWSLAGWPAAVVPAGVHRAGVPLAVQLVARPGGEPVLLSIARELERLRPWRRIAPGYDQAPRAVQPA